MNIRDLRAKLIKCGSTMLVDFGDFKAQFSFEKASYLNKPKMLQQDGKPFDDPIEAENKFRREAMQLSRVGWAQLMYLLFMDSNSTAYDKETSVNREPSYCKNIMYYHLGSYMCNRLKNKIKMKESGKVDKKAGDEFKVNANKLFVDGNNECILEVYFGEKCIKERPEDTKDGQYINDDLVTLNQIRTHAIENREHVYCKLKGIKEKISLLPETSHDLLCYEYYYKNNDKKALPYCMNKGMATLLESKRTMYKIPEDQFRQMVYLACLVGHFTYLDPNTDVKKIAQIGVLSDSEREKHIGIVLKRRDKITDEKEIARINAYLESIGYKEKSKPPQTKKEPTQEPTSVGSGEPQRRGPKKRKPWGKNRRSRVKSLNEHNVNVMMFKEKQKLNKKRFKTAFQGTPVMPVLDPKDSSKYEIKVPINEKREALLDQRELRHAKGEDAFNKPINHKLRMPVTQPITKEQREKRAKPYQAKWRNFETNAITVTKAVEIVLKECNIPAGVPVEDIRKAVINGEHNDVLSRYYLREPHKFTWGRKPVEHKKLKRDTKVRKPVESKLVCVRDAETANVHRIPREDADLQIMQHPNRLKIVSKSVWKAAKSVGKAKYGLDLTTKAERTQMVQLRQHAVVDSLTDKLKAIVEPYMGTTTRDYHKGALKQKRKINRISAKLKKLTVNEKVGKKAEEVKTTLERRLGKNKRKKIKLSSIPQAVAA